MKVDSTKIGGYLVYKIDKSYNVGVLITRDGIPVLCGVVDSDDELSEITLLNNGLVVDEGRELYRKANNKINAANEPQHDLTVESLLLYPKNSNSKIRKTLAPYIIAELDGNEFSPLGLVLYPYPQRMLLRNFNSVVGDLSQIQLREIDDALQDIYAQVFMENAVLHSSTDSLGRLTEYYEYSSPNGVRKLVFSILSGKPLDVTVNYTDESNPVLAVAPDHITYSDDNDTVRTARLMDIAKQYIDPQALKDVSAQLTTTPLR